MWIMRVTDGLEGFGGEATCSDFDPSALTPKKEAALEGGLFQSGGRRDIRDIPSGTFRTSRTFRTA
jgi:hypothetical protein